MVIGSARDTGIKLFERFSLRPGIRHETFTPVYKPGEDRLMPPPGVRLDSRSTLRDLLEHIRPDWLRFVPRRRGYFTRTGFRDLGLRDLRAEGGEEVFWQKRPVAFHLRGGLGTKRPAAGELERIRDLTETLVTLAEADDDLSRQDEE